MVEGILYTFLLPKSLGASSLKLGSQPIPGPSIQKIFLVTSKHKDNNERIGNQTGTEFYCQGCDA